MINPAAPPERPDNGGGADRRRRRYRAPISRRAGRGNVPALQFAAETRSNGLPRRRRADRALLHRVQGNRRFTWHCMPRSRRASSSARSDVAIELFSTSAYSKIDRAGRSSPHSCGRRRAHPRWHRRCATGMSLLADGVVRRVQGERQCHRQPFVGQMRVICGTRPQVESDIWRSRDVQPRPGG